MIWLYVTPPLEVFKDRLDVRTDGQIAIYTQTHTLTVSGSYYLYASATLIPP